MNAVIRRLDDDTPEPVRRQLDRILDESRAALVGPDEHLALVDERIGEAAGDPERGLYYAIKDGLALGLIDAHYYRPDSGAFTVAHLAVNVGARGQGVGRALVEVVAAAAQDLGLLALYAATRPGHPSADAFWEALGCTLDEEGPTRVYRRGD
ncbi:MAG: GNAT family N-acetyltransferase [Deltaproteobacteria bacterium]|jgi:GNAT superfamily N-acetyltransferase|nr:GNAT family N-acetyltransferase [Deltaproteobacteria bacterium]